MLSQFLHSVTLDLEWFNPINLRATVWIYSPVSALSLHLYGVSPLASLEYSALTARSLRDKLGPSASAERSVQLSCKLIVTQTATSNMAVI